MDGQSRPYFHGITQKLSFQQRLALAQGIQQVVATTPPGFNAFEFQFTGLHAHIYKLEHGITLLVLTNRLSAAKLRNAVEQLRLELKDEQVTSAIALFRMMAGNLPIPPLPNTLSEDLPPSSVSVNPHSSGNSSLQNGASIPPAQPPPPAPPPPPPPPFPSASPVSPSATSCTLSDLLSAMNQISQFTTRYLGSKVVSNYWNITRPTAKWLSHFQIDRAAQITFTDHLPSEQSILTPQQRAWVKTWVQAFSKRCSVVMRDFPALLNELPLEPQVKACLFPLTPGE